MPRFLVSPQDLTQGRFVLRGAEARHARIVLRKKVGDTLALFDGKDLSLEGRIDCFSKDRLEGVILGTTPSREVRASVVLCPALLKGPKWDWLLEKACEIGVSRLAPIFTRRTIVQATDRDARKEERWRKIVLAASKQCGRSQLMSVDAPIPFPEALERMPKTAQGLIPWEKEDSKPLRDLSSHDIWLFIGPEGGWETGEISLARRHGVIPVRLGPTLLRSETASIVAATLVLRERGVY